MKRNILFDLAASIETEKEWPDLSTADLVNATRERLNQIELEGNAEAFGFCDEYEVEG